MRRWTLTLLLAIAAAAAASMAPRLVGIYRPVALPVHTPKPIARPSTERSPLLLPEINEPLVPVAPPKTRPETPPPPPEGFWPDAVDCGMG